MSETTDGTTRPPLYAIDIIDKTLHPYLGKIMARSAAFRVLDVLRLAGFVKECVINGK